MKLSDLKNIGKTVEKQLNEVGVITSSDLKKMGAAQIYRLIKKKKPDQTIPVCYYLYSLEGAIQDRHWDDFSEKEKEKLRKAAGID